MDEVDVSGRYTVLMCGWMIKLMRGYMILTSLPNIEIALKSNRTLQYRVAYA